MLHDQKSSQTSGHHPSLWESCCLEGGGKPFLHTRPPQGVPSRLTVLPPPGLNVNGFLPLICFLPLLLPLPLSPCKSPLLSPVTPHPFTLPARPSPAASVGPTTWMLLCLLLFSSRPQRSVTMQFGFHPSLCCSPPPPSLISSPHPSSRVQIPPGLLSPSSLQKDPQVPELS